MTSEIIISLITLIALEIVLGIDNVVFISILTDKLPEEQRKRARFVGLSGALGMRLVLLSVVSWIMKLDKPLFELFGVSYSGKSLILIFGGLFLLYKASKEIFLNSEHINAKEDTKKVSFNEIIFQILLLDLVFSVDSIITAVGLVDQVWVMYVAVIVAIVISLALAKPIATTLQKHPSLKILALSFLMMIGLALLADGFNVHIPKGYIYTSMIFALLVDLIQIQKNKT